MVSDLFDQKSSSRNQRQLDKGDFDHFRHFLQEACGIFLGENKQYLVITRIRRILAEEGIDNLRELVEMLRRGRHSKLRQTVIDAMTTNETFWFRDTYPYEHLKNHLLPELMQQGRGTLRIWSAACSSGQEPYSISMTVEEYRRQGVNNLPRPVEIVATDLSSSVLAQARSGEYDRMSVIRGLSRDRLAAFFDQLNEEVWRVKPMVSDRVDFRSLNLMDPYLGLGKFDIVFCRNVLIYFSGDLKRDILRRIHAALKPGGILFLGSSEGLAGVANLFEMVNCNPGIMYRAL